VRGTLDVMDQHYRRISQGGVGELRFLEPCLLDRLPSEYWESNCAVTASFMHRDDCAQRHAIGVERVMWGSDYPHLEGTAPFSREAVRRTFAGVPRKETEAMLGGNAARIYGFNIAALQPIADRVGPTVAEVDSGLDAVPEGAVSLAFQDRPPLNV